MVLLLSKIVDFVGRSDSESFIFCWKWPISPVNCTYSSENWRFYYEISKFCYENGHFLQKWYYLSRNSRFYSFFGFLTENCVENGQLHSKIVPILPKIVDFMSKMVDFAQQNRFYSKMVLSLSKIIVFVQFLAFLTEISIKLADFRQ